MSDRIVIEIVPRDGAHIKTHIVASYDVNETSSTPWEDYTIRGIQDSDGHTSIQILKPDINVVSKTNLLEERTLPDGEGKNSTLNIKDSKCSPWSKAKVTATRDNNL